MTALTTQHIVDVGTAPTFVAATVADSATSGNGTDTFVVYKNTSATAVNVTILVPGNTTYGQPMPDPVIAIPITTGEKWIPLRPEYDDGTGHVQLTASAAPAGLTVAVVTVH
jgi:hypothetical protein